MKRSEVAHVIRAAKALTEEREFVLVGSQAAHLALDRLPPEMEQSGELDIYPRRRPDLADLIDGSIGEGSLFHSTHGYYAQGVGPETAKLPRGWEARAVRVSNDAIDRAVAIAPEIHDLCASKLAALRPKDFSYVEAALEAGLARAEVLAERLALIDGLAPEVRAVAEGWLSQRRDGQAPDAPGPHSPTSR